MCDHLNFNCLPMARFPSPGRKCVSYAKREKLLKLEQYLVRLSTLHGTPMKSTFATVLMNFTVTSNVVLPSRSDSANQPSMCTRSVLTDCQQCWVTSSKGVPAHCPIGQRQLLFLLHTKNIAVMSRATNWNLVHKCPLSQHNSDARRRKIADVYTDPQSIHELLN